MQTELGGRNHHSQSPIVVPDLEEFEFKALDEGLGFHQKQERPRWKSSATARPTTHTAATATNRIQQQNSISREQLGMIYAQDLNAKAPSSAQPAKSATKAKVTVKAASLVERFSAQLADTVLLTGAVALMLFAMLKLAQVPNNEVLALLRSSDIIPVIAVLWLVSYVAYFSILETRQTPGKRMMRLRVVELDGSALTLSRSLERTAFRTLSWLALGFPLLMNFHGRLSRTQVIRA